ncbi:MAG: hypothetical protein ACE362_02970 [Phaeodactylibacter xiamenensis]|uniref:Uncharacterized protein n=1 Tax=Phaeodactylibacter xiamenensis TaxID=1524460 RepID=A0A098S151_9BACT|nr:hypothetical protein [Phaeodactylibacter xiamenensis]KGE85820.1 hypothetical protein IX84_24610 [Phaeodactylibacter xiamenensis]MCR9051194.1 hypothetical protein [bacterium]
MSIKPFGLITALLFLLSSPVQSQTNSISAKALIGDLQQAIDDAADKGERVIQASIGNIHQDSVRNIFRFLTLGKRYRILAFAEGNEIEDIDLRVYRSIDDKWMMEIQDRGDSSKGQVYFEPPATAMYRIVIDAYGYQESIEYGKFAMLISLTD